MPGRYWAETNVLLRLATGTPPDLFERALGLIERAEAGEFALAVHPMQAAEACHVLAGFYREERSEIQRRLEPVLSLRAVP